MKEHVHIICKEYVMKTIGLKEKMRVWGPETLY